MLRKRSPMLVLLLVVVVGVVVGNYLAVFTNLSSFVRQYGKESLGPIPEMAERDGVAEEKSSQPDRTTPSSPPTPSLHRLRNIETPVPKVVVPSSEKKVEAVVTLIQNTTRVDSKWETISNQSESAAAKPPTRVESNATLVSPPPSKHPLFVPFPHNPMPYGKDAKCEWVARDPSDEKNPVVQSLLGPDARSPDKMQKKAFNETICLGESSTNLHLFSSVQAQACLKGITLFITGDSYNRQLYIGLADILLNSWSSKELTNALDRKAELRSRQKSLERQWAKLGTDVRWGCDNACRGASSPFSRLCSDCLSEVRKKNGGKKVVPVLGASVHIFSSMNGNVPKVLNEMLGLFENLEGGIIFNSQPSYDIERVPGQYQNATRGVGLIYTGLLDMVPNWENKVRFLDFFQLTDSCRFSNCSIDGGHRARFVNRWKAQLLLNTICSLPSKYSFLVDG